MPTLGEELKGKREERGITLAEISDETRIGTRFLKAIESDNFAVLPGGIFTRSFIRAYAKQVGMDEDQAISRYVQQTAAPMAEEQKSVSEPIESSAPGKVSDRPNPVRPAPEERSRQFEPIVFRGSPSRTSWPAIVIGSGIVVFIVIVVLLLVKQLNQGSSETGSHATSVAQKNATSNPPTQPDAQKPAQPVPPEQPESAEASAQPLIVKVEAATGDSWIRYQVDDAKPTTLVLKQGQSQDIPPAQSQVTLNYGNRLTLKLRINNRDANFPPETPKFASQVVISRNNFQTYFQ
jgi:cytoskeletal protein RodZ